MAFKMKGFTYPTNRKAAINKEPQGKTKDGRAKSSAFQKVDEKADMAAYDKVVNSITADMTDDQLRKLVVAHNKGKARKYNISYKHAQSLRNEEARLKKEYPSLNK